jgi:hypothetical protein
MANVPGVRGKTFDLKVDTDNHIVYVGEDELVRGARETSLFVKAYIMGRDHKKLEIRSSLNL